MINGHPVANYACYHQVSCRLPLWCTENSLPAVGACQPPLLGLGCSTRIPMILLVGLRAWHPLFRFSSLPLLCCKYFTCHAATCRTHMLILCCALQPAADVALLSRCTAPGPACGVLAGFGSIDHGSATWLVSWGHRRVLHKHVRRPRGMQCSFA